MPRQKRPFYIIGHNPNTIEEAVEFLDSGANALEPDIVYAEGRFYVSHHPQLSYSDVPTVQDYLQSLKALLLARQYDLALLIWDFKTTDFDPNQFMAVVKENFSGGPCDGVAMLMTHSADYDFVNRYKGGYQNVGVGVDESDVPPSALEAIFKNAGQGNFSYADGITTFLTKTGVFKNVTAALQCRTRHETNSFKFIYTWVLTNEALMCKYLDIYIDGIMVEVGSVKDLKALVTAIPYSEAYQLAQNGYNPFFSASLPAYILTITTKNKLLAGTDAQILFTLTGKSGSLKSLPYNGNEAGVLERGSTNYVTLEGMDLGEIQSLYVEVLTTGIGSGWLPENISVSFQGRNKKIDFVFNDQDWITKKGGAVTKFPV